MRSLRNKIPAFEAIVELEKIDICCLVETFLSAEDESALFTGGLSNHYSVFRYDRTDRPGGGVLIMCATSTRPVKVTVPTQYLHIEIVVVDLNCITDRLRLICVYRPPNSGDLYFRDLCDVVKHLASVNYPTVLCGDLNLGEIDWTKLTCPETFIYEKFLDCILECTFTQYVLEPTRGNKILDIIACNETNIVTNVQVCPGLASSDHLSVTFNLPSTCSPMESYTVLDFRKADITQLRAKLQQVNWDFLFSECYSGTTLDIENFWSVFTNVLRREFNLAIPSRTIHSARMHSRTYPGHILRLQKKKKRLWRLRYSPSGMLNYRNCADKCDRAISAFAKSQEMFVLTSEDQSLFFKYVNKYRKSRADIPPSLTLMATLLLNLRKNVFCLMITFALFLAKTTILTRLSPGKELRHYSTMLPSAAMLFLIR